MIHGIINVYKEKGYTSHDVVAKMRGIVKQKRIGHTGTLDPDAQGVLPVCLGNATRLCDMLTDKDKTYRAVLLLGIATDTQDITGTVIREAPVAASVEQVKKTVMGFVGEYEQVPPMYSALKVNGRKLYELAREGIEVERKARRVMIHSIQIEKIELPRVEMTVTCSKGTYIRTLCSDIGDMLGCGGCMESLLRTRVGRFTAEDGLTLSEIEKLVSAGGLDEYIVPVDAMFDSCPAVYVSDDYRKLIDNGNLFPLKALSAGAEGLESGHVRVYSSEGCFYGIYDYKKDAGIFSPVKMFLAKE